MGVDVVIGILSKLNPYSLWNMCSTNRDYMRVCKENKDIILRNILRGHNVEYENSRSLLYLDRVRVRGVYQYRYVNISDYMREDGSYKLGEIFLRYKKLWYNESGEINVGGLGISNIPKMPRLRSLICEGNNLRELPDFDRLEVLDCRGNEIERLGRMPRLVELYVSNNPIREIGDLDSIEYMDGKLLKLERLYNMPSMSVITVGVSRKIKLEGIRGGEVRINILDVDGSKSMEFYMPETVDVYVSRLDIRLVEGDEVGINVD
jgi:hypothetical protein